MDLHLYSVESIGYVAFESEFFMVNYMLRKKNICSCFCDFD
jgi:hypothetical protein